MRTLTTELLLDAQAELAEGPFWDAATERLLWVDILPGVVHRCDDTGSPTGGSIVEVPASQTTSCAFGGPGRRQLFITTAQVGLSPQERAEQPHAGGLFVCEPGTAGAVTPSFAG